jgi:acyl carrier protein
MTDAQILDLIRQALTNVVPDRAADWSTVQLDMTIEELGLDSISTMEMVGQLEDATNTTFPDEALPKVNSLADLAHLCRTA